MRLGLADATVLTAGFEIDFVAVTLVFATLLRAAFGLAADFSRLSLAAFLGFVLDEEVLVAAERAPADLRAGRADFFLIPDDSRFMKLVV